MIEQQPLESQEEGWFTDRGLFVALTIRHPALLDRTVYGSLELMLAEEHHPLFRWNRPAWDAVCEYYFAVDMKRVESGEKKLRRLAIPPFNESEARLYLRLVYETPEGETETLVSLHRTTKTKQRHLRLREWERWIRYCCVECGSELHTYDFVYDQCPVCVGEIDPPTNTGIFWAESKKPRD